MHIHERVSGSARGGIPVVFVQKWWWFLPLGILKWKGSKGHSKVDKIQTPSWVKSQGSAKVSSIILEAPVNLVIEWLSGFESCCRTAQEFASVSTETKLGGFWSVCLFSFYDHPVAYRVPRPGVISQPQLQPTPQPWHGQILEPILPDGGLEPASWRCREPRSGCATAGTPELGVFMTDL